MTDAGDNRSPLLEQLARRSAPAIDPRVPQDPGANPIGLVGNEAKLGGIAFYSDRRVVALSSADDIRGFLAAGGRTLVLKARKLDRVEEVTSVEVRAQIRVAQQGAARRVAVEVVGHEDRCEAIEHRRMGGPERVGEPACQLEQIGRAHV